MEINIDALNNQLAANSAQNNAASLRAAREQMAFQVAQNAKAMSFNEEQARINREWQERLSNTAHQREVADLLAAGLNPILAANSGASTPSGSAAQGVTSAGAMAQVDTSRNSAIASVLNSIINADASMHNAEVNAKSAVEAAGIHAEASKYGSELSSEATKIAAGIAAEASKYGSNMSYAAQKYMADHPNTNAGLIRIVAEGMSGTSVKEASKNIIDWAKSVFEDLFMDKNDKKEYSDADKDYYRKVNQGMEKGYGNPYGSKKPLTNPSESN